jgi:hypothetical protein
MSHSWFRFYNCVVDDPKVQRLPDAAFRAWVNLMCIANKNGGRISKDYADIAFSLRVTASKARDLIQVLISAKLIDQDANGFEPHDWGDWQYESDGAAERMRRYRKRNKARNGAVTGDVTAERNALRNCSVPDTEQTRTEQTQILEAKASSPATAARDGEALADKPKWWPKRDRYGRVVSDLTDKVIYDVGKAVLGKDAGGQITKLRKCYRGDLRAVADLLLQAEDKSDPSAW